MWRPTRLIARRALSSRHYGSAEFRQIRCFVKVLQSQSQASTVALAESESHFVRYNSSSSTTCFCQLPRFFSSIPSFGNEESNQSNDSRFDYDEKSFSSVSESLLSEESNVANQETNESSVDSPFGVDESPSSFSSEFNELIQSTTGSSHSNDELASENGNSNDWVASENGSDGPVVAEGENDADKVENLLSLLQSSGNFGSLESSIEGMGLVLNEGLVMRVLETTFVPGENLIGFFKWILKNKESLLTTEVVDLLVKAISRENRIRDAYALWDLFKVIGVKDINVLTTDILNQLISLLSKLGKGKAAFEVFNKFEDFDCLPDSDTYYWTIDALSRRSIFDWASSVCDKMLNAEKFPDGEKVGKIICHLCQGKKLQDAHNIYTWAKGHNIHPPQSSVNFFISSLCRKEKPQEVVKKRQKDKSISHSQVAEIVSPEEKENIYLALKMLDDLPAEERKHAARSFSFVASGLCRIKDIQGAKDLLFKMIEAGPPPGYTIFNTIITGFARAGNMEEAMKLVHIMESRGLKPDVYTYAVVMNGYVEGAAMEEAHKILVEAKKKHSKLSPIVYYTLIRGYSKLEQFDMVRELMAEMKEYGIQPNANEYKRLIKSLCLKALDWRTAEKLLQEMQESGLHLNELTKSLVKAVKELEEEGLRSQALSAAA